MAITRGSPLEYIKAFMDAGADVNIKDNEGHSPLDYARTRNDPALLQMLSPPRAPAKIEYDTTNALSITRAFAFAVARYEPAIIEAVYPRDARNYDSIDNLNSSYDMMADVPEEYIEIYEVLGGDGAVRNNQFFIVDSRTRQNVREYYSTVFPRRIRVACGRRGPNFVITNVETYSTIGYWELGRRVM